MRPIYKKTILILLDVILFVYVIVAMVSFNKPDESQKVCSEVNIQIADESSNGFLSAGEVKKILEINRMYPLNVNMTSVQPRMIEDLLCQSPFVNTAECYKTQNNHVCITITQRLPIIRIKSQGGDDYYLDDKGGIMPNSKYTSDLIIATGNINKWFARNYIAPMANVIMANDLWKNMIEQINVLPDLGIEIVPRVGDHIVYLGTVPQTRNVAKRKILIEDFVSRKLTRLEKFYRYGLSQVGWNKYPYINIEFDNQIICKRHTAGNEIKHVESTASVTMPVEQKTNVEQPAEQKSQESKAKASLKPNEVRSEKKAEVKSRSSEEKKKSPEVKSNGQGSKKNSKEKINKKVESKNGKANKKN